MTRQKCTCTDTIIFSGYFQSVFRFMDVESTDMKGQLYLFLFQWPLISILPSPFIYTLYFLIFLTTTMYEHVTKFQPIG